MYLPQLKWNLWVFWHMNCYCNEREKYNIEASNGWFLNFIKVGMSYTMLAERWQYLILWDNTLVNCWDCFKLLQWTTILILICMLPTETWCKTNKTGKCISLNQLFEVTKIFLIYLPPYLCKILVKIHLDTLWYHSESYNTDKRLLNLIALIKRKKKFWEIK